MRWQPITHFQLARLDRLRHARYRDPMGGSIGIHAIIVCQTMFELSQRIDLAAWIAADLTSGSGFWHRIFLMPHKLNQDRRHKIPKQKFKVRNRHLTQRYAIATSPKSKQRPDGLAEIHRLHSTQPDRDPDGSMEDCDRPEPEGAELPQSDHRSKDRRSCSQPDDGTWLSRVQARCIKNSRVG